MTKIYESPDGGKTIYVREAGSDTRKLIKQDPCIAHRNMIAKRTNRLLTILKLAETDATLKDALEALEALYILKYGDDQND